MKNMRFVTTICYFIILLGMNFELGAAISKLPEASQMPANQRHSGMSPSAEWQKKWDETVAAAKKEGELVIYSGVNPETVKALRSAFALKYGIRLNFVIGMGGEIATKYKTEQTAGLNIPGAFNLSPSLKPQGFFAPLEPYLLLPEVKDPKVWIGGKIPYLDKEKSIIMLNRGYTSYVAVNTNIVKEGQITSEFIRIGAPVGIIRWQEGGMINTATGNLEVPFKVANPNAATVYINWILTKEGQTIFAKSYGNPSWRSDVPADDIHPSRVANPGEKLYMDDTEFYSQMMKAIKLAKEIFTQAQN